MGERASSVSGKELKSMKQKLSFPGPRGNNLSAYLELPADKQPAAYAIFAHCFTCSKNIITATRIAAGLAARGVAVLRFDFEGIGDSEGEFTETNLSTNIDDLVSACRFLEDHYEAPVLIIGHSLGGAAAIMAADSVPAVRALVTIAVPDHPSHLRDLLRDSMPAIEQRGSAEVMIGGSRFNITRQLMDDVLNHDLVEALSRLQQAILVIHSRRDETVGIEHAYRLFDAAAGSKSFLSLDTADHILSNPADAEYVVEVLYAWLSPVLHFKPD